MLPFYLDQGRERRAEAAQRLRGGPCGPGGHLGAQGGRGGGRWRVGARRGHLQGGWRWAKMGHRILIVFFFKRCD